MSEISRTANGPATALCAIEVTMPAFSVSGLKAVGRQSAQVKPLRLCSFAKLALDNRAADAKLIEVI